MKLGFPRVSAAFLVMAGPAWAECAAAPGHPTLTVQGAAVVRRPPDRAEITVSVETSGPTLEAAARAHRDRVAQATAVLNRLKGDGVAVDDGTFGLSQEWSPPPAGAPSHQMVTDYRAVTRYDLAVARLDRLDGLVTAIASSGLFKVDPASFSATEAAAARDAARREAVVDARRRAEIYADAAGLRIAGVECMAEGVHGSDGGEFRVQAGVETRPSIGLAPPKFLQFADDVTVVWRAEPR